jgi:hypothetical protein
MCEEMVKYEEQTQGIRKRKSVTISGYLRRYRVHRPQYTRVLCPQCQAELGSHELRTRDDSKSVTALLYMIVSLCRVYVLTVKEHFCFVRVCKTS